MENYTKIGDWKDKSLKCKYCRNQIDVKQDYFVLSAHWKIKKKADEHVFCSLKCMTNWAKED